MALNFQPSKNYRGSDPDMVARKVTHTHAQHNHITHGIDFKIAIRLLDQLGYVNGDRVTGNYDKGVLTLTRVGIDDPRPAYKIALQRHYTTKSGRKKAYNSGITFRFGLDANGVKEFFGDRDRKHFEFLENNGKGAVFVESNN